MRRHRPIQLLAALAVVVLGALLAPVPANAEETVSGGRLDWGVKSSFRAYVAGPVAKGEIALLSGADDLGGAFRFHSASGEYDSDSGAYAASYRGGVRFRGHRTESGDYEMDLTLSNPTVTVSGGGGTLLVDVGTPSGVAAQVEFASLDLSGLDTSGAAGSLGLTNLPARLTAAGAAAFDGYYEAGEQLDPVSFSGEFAAPDDDEEAETEGADAEGEFGEAVLDWGVRQSWREHVRGDLVDGGWSLTDGAEDGGAVFRFPDGEGRFAEERLDVEFVGAIAFSGDGVDLELSGFTVTAQDGAGLLAADAGSRGEEHEDLPLAEFAFEEPTFEDGLLLIESATVALAEEAADLFDGYYPAGAELDPLTIAVPLEAGAELPPLPDVGSAPETAESSAAESASAAVEPVESATWLWIGTAVLAVLAAVVAAVTLRRRRSRTAADATPAGPDGTTTTDPEQPDSADDEDATANSNHPRQERTPR